MKTARHILFLIILLGMLLPGIQNNILKIKMKPLIGIKDTLTKPVFTTKTFRNMTFQERMGTWYTQQLGFRPWLIRLRNQVDYSLFNYTNSEGVVIGKEGDLFLGSYINNYCGIEFQGVRKINYEVKRLSLISRELKKKNVDLLIVLAPGKATFDQEMIPERFRKRPVTNYGYYSTQLASAGLNVMDLNAWFRNMKNKASYPFFSKNGVHWSSYAVALAADTLIKYIEKIRGIDMPEISIPHVTMSDSLHSSDNDAADLMNLLRDPYNGPMPYPEFTYNQAGKTRPNVVTIADSYWWGIITTGISRNIFGKARYWFYGKDIYEDENKVGTVATIDMHAELEQQDVVILLLSEATWQLFPFGFSDAFLKNFAPETEADREAQIGILMDNIRRTPDWYRAVADKAARLHVPVEEQLRQDALYLIDQEKNKK